MINKFKENMILGNIYDGMTNKEKESITITFEVISFDELKEKTKKSLGKKYEPCLNQIKQSLLLLSDIKKKSISYIAFQLIYENDLEENHKNLLTIAEEELKPEK